MPWGPWIEHDGEGCPVEGQLVQCTTEHLPGEYHTIEGVAGPCRSWFWSEWLVFSAADDCLASRVVRYRVWLGDSAAFRDLVEIARNPAREVVDA